MLWPNVVALLAGLGLPQAHRYYLARQPETFSQLFSNALLFTMVMGVVAYGALKLQCRNWFACAARK